MSPRKRCYIVINGILNNPKDQHAWTDRAVIWIQTTPGNLKAEKYEYACDAIFRRWGQAGRVKDVIELVKAYSAKGYDVDLVGHSNGADIISRLLLEKSCLIREVHLVAGACERDCAKNGINSAMAEGRLERAFIYCSKSDEALTWARNTHPFLQVFGLGYGTMGLEGPLNAHDNVTVMWFDGFKHCDYWKEENFDKILRLITHRPPTPY